MSQISRLIVGNTIVFSIGLGLARAIAFVGLPLLTHLIADPTIFGYYDLTVALATMAAGVASFGITEGAYKAYFSQTTKERKRQVIQTTLTLGTGFSLLVSLLWLGASSVIPVRLGSWDIADLGIIVTMMLMATRIRHLAELPLMLENHRVKIVGVTLAETAIFYTIALAAIRLAGDETTGVEFLAYCRLLAMVVAAGVLFILGRRHHGFKDYSSTTAKEILAVGLPLAPSSLLYAGMAMTDRVAVSGLLGSASLGVYAVAAKFAAVGEFLRSAVTQGLWYAFYKSHALEGHELRMRALSEIFLTVAMIAFVMTRELAPLIFGAFVAEGYEAGHVVLPYLLVAPLFLTVAQIVGAELIRSAHGRYITLSQVVSVALIIVLCIYLAPIAGLLGIAIATVAGYLSMLCLGAAFVDLHRLAKPSHGAILTSVWMVSSAGVIDILFPELHRPVGIAIFTCVMACIALRVRTWLVALK